MGETAWVKDFDDGGDGRYRHPNKMSKAVAVNAQHDLANV